MKKLLQQKLILFFASILARPVLFAFRSTLKIRLIHSGILKELRRQQKNFILAVWHEYAIFSVLAHEGQNIHVLVSQHFDGEVIARILRVFGNKAIRGSSTRGGKQAYSKMKSKMESGRFEAAFTPDGPTGPRRQAKLGVVRLASETGAAIVPIGVAASHYKRMRSWDRMLLILPFSKCVLYYGKPFRVSPGLNEAELKEQAGRLTVLINESDREAAKCLG